MSLSNNILLTLQLFDGATDKFVQAYLFDQDGNAISTVNLNGIGQGCYISNTVSIPDGVIQVIAIYRVFNDSGYTQRSKLHSDAIDTFGGGNGMTEIIVTNQNTVTGKIEPVTAIFGKIESDFIFGKIAGPETITGKLEQEQDLKC